MLKGYNINIIKSFNGYVNYTNMTAFKGNILIRKECLIQDKKTDFVLSSIVDKKDEDIIKYNIDKFYLHSYEDPRFISKNKFTFNMAYSSENTNLLGIKMCYGDLKTKEFDLYNFKKENSDFEKNWQVNKSNIIYNLEPVEIYNNNFEIIHQYKPNPKWEYWKKKYGIPRLSTNIFEIDEKKYVIFHSNIVKTKSLISGLSKPQTKGIGGKLQYFCGLAEVTDDYIPIRYYVTPLFPSFSNFKTKLKSEYLRWRSRTNITYDVDIVFPLNTETIKDTTHIHCGINDCIAATINVDNKEIRKFISESKSIKL